MTLRGCAERTSLVLESNLTLDDVYLVKPLYTLIKNTNFDNVAINMDQIQKYLSDPEISRVYHIMRETNIHHVNVSESKCEKWYCCGNQEYVIFPLESVLLVHVDFEIDAFVFSE